MSSAIIGIDITKWKHESALVRAIHLETGGEPNNAGVYLLNLISEGKWTPGERWMTFSGRDEMELLLNGGHIVSLETRIKSSGKATMLAESVSTREGWDKAIESYKHAYLYSWRMGTIYYQGRVLPPDKPIYEMSATLMEYCK